MPAASRRITPESLVAALVAGPAAMMAAGYLLDAIGLPIAPAVVAGIALLASVAAFLVTREPSAAPAGSVAGFVAVAAAALAYFCWLASPSLLPITDGPDVVHHLQLIHVIERTHHLVHDAALGPYLGEMADYTPGSHIVAAMAGVWLGVDPVRVLFAVTAAFAAVKVGIVYALALRVLPSARGAALAALAAPILLLVPSAYLIGAFFRFYFYSQVVSETFAVAMVLMAIGWMRTGLRAYVWVAAACGVAIVLSWPVWIVPAAIAVVSAILLGPLPVRPDREGVADASAAHGAASFVPWRERLYIAALVLAPCVVFGLWHTLAHPSGASIVRSGGVVQHPSLEVLGAGFVVLAAVGLVVAVTVASARPLAVLLAAAAGVALALAPSAAPSYYLPAKMVYLAVLPGAVLGALTLSLAVPWIARVPMLRVAAPIVPVLVAAILASGRVPVERQSGPITEPSLAAGLWARGVLPPGCVDYFSRHWLTGYWLHLDVLGNPRDSDRMRAETFEFHDTVSKWIEGRGLPYAIVEDLAAIPRDARADMIELRTFPPAAIVKNRRAGSDPKIPLCAGK